MTLTQLLISFIALITIISFVMPKFYAKEPDQCIQLQTGPQGKLKDGQFCDDQACRPITVKWEEIEC